MKKIAILLSAYVCEPNRGSEPGNGWNWGRYLALRGHEVHLLTRVDSREKIEQELSHTPNPNLKVHYIDVPNWSKRFRIGQAGVYFHYLIWQKQAYLYAKKTFKKIDIVHHVTWGSLRGGSGLWKLGYPFIMGPIGGGQTAPKNSSVFFENEWHKEWMRTILVKYITFLLPSSRSLVRNSSLVLATNLETVQFSRDLGARKTLLFFDTGLSTDFIPEKNIHQKTKELKILWVGRIYPIKGLSLVLLALQKVDIPFKLTIIGDGPWGYKIPGWIDKFDLSNRVNWVGQIPWLDVKKAYSEHDAFMFTSFRDSCPAQLLEAMAFGIPIVTLNHHGSRDLVPDNAGFKVDVTTPEETSTLLARAIERLWLEPALRERMSLAVITMLKPKLGIKK